MADFYSTVAGVSFLLLGFWWSVSQSRHDEWMSDPRQKRMAFDMSASFLLLGTMSTVAILGVERAWVWQAGFVVAAVVGIVEAGAMLRTALPDASTATWFRAAHGGAIGIYALMGIIALDPKLPSRIGIELTGIEAEALMVSLLLFVSANLAWLLMATPRARAAG